VEGQASGFRALLSDARFELLHDRLAACSDAQNWPRLVRTCTEATRYSFETGRLLALVTAPSRPLDAHPAAPS
jgi:hypothetical protein